MINTTQEQKRKGSCSNVEIKQKPVATLLLPVLSWNNRKPPKNYHLQPPPNTTTNSSSMGTGAGFSRGIQGQLGKRAIPNATICTLVLHSGGDIGISFHVARAGPGQTCARLFGAVMLQCKVNETPLTGRLIPVQHRAPRHVCQNINARYAPVLTKNIS